MTPAHDTPVTQGSSWLERFVERCFEASANQMARDIRSEAPSVYEQLIGDLETPLAPPFEAAVAHRLASGDTAGLIPARTLMPEMMVRFGVSPVQFEADQELTGLERTCNRCSAVGRCWSALRHGADAATCRTFCPNAPAFEEKGVSAS
ncbi:hypothetical protein [Halomonas sp. BM-2019]|uniref:hypothetical protein n=1 Tax=Halomonas sp. BM-2019 TaxID=2811227 RepID=UPI001B3C25CD|nr:MAG: hypothetical protein J5F18_00940 [Halomonas sp. BM-2019]